MNEKIKEIALKSGGSHYPNVNPQQLQLFAELIIKECIDAVEKGDCRNIVFTTFDRDQEAGVKQRCINSIKDRFGVVRN